MILLKKHIFLSFLALVTVLSFSFVFSPLWAQEGDSAGGNVSSVKESLEKKGKTSPAKAADRVPGGNFEEKDFRPRVDEESRGSLMFQVVLILFLLAGGFYLFYRFVSRKVGFRSSGEGIMETLSAVSLGPGRYVYIVDVVGRVLVLGVTDSNVTLLREIEDRDEKDRIRLMSSQTTIPRGKNLGELLSTVIGGLVDRLEELKEGRGKKNKMRNFGDILDRGDTEKVDDNVDFLKSQKNRLRKINEDD